jgi:CBS domain-containing protein
MNLARFFDRDLINIDLQSRTKLEAVDSLADLFCRKYSGKDKQAIIKAVLEREDLGSTSFGRGFAFPHARTDAVDDLYIAFGIARNGVADKTPDGFPIKAICLLLTPRNISKLYLQTLSGLASFARRPGMLEQLLAASSIEALIDIIEKTGIEVKRALTVNDIMTDNVISVSPDETLKNVANIMFRYKFDSVPVVDPDGRLLGEISGMELLRSALTDHENAAAASGCLSEMEPFEDLLRREDRIAVKQVMNANVATISDTAPVIEAAILMLSRNVERIMVVKDGHLVGVVTSADIFSKIIRG